MSITDLGERPRPGYGSVNGSMSIDNQSDHRSISNRPISNRPINDEYPRRWYVLVHNVLVMTMTMLIFLFYGSISVSLQFVYGWSSLVFEMYGVSGLVAFFLTFAPTVWLLNKYSCKVYIAFAATGTFLSALLRCFGKTSYVANVLGQIAIFIVGLTANASLYYPIALVDEFFPPSERNVALSAAVLVPQFGPAIAYSLAIFVVPGPAAAHYDKQLILGRIFVINYIFAAIAAVLCFGVIFYPRPHEQHSVRRDDGTEIPGLTLVLHESKAAFRDWKFWLIAFRFVFTVINSSLMVVWPLYLQTKGLTQSQTGIIMTISNVLMVVSGVVVGWVCDRISQRSIKVVLLLGSILYFIGCDGVLITTNKYAAAFFISMAVVLSGATWGAAFSAGAADLGITEVTTNGWVIFVYSAIAVFFYVITKITHGSLVWVSYYQAFSSAVGVVLSLWYIHV